MKNEDFKAVLEKFDRAYATGNSDWFDFLSEDVLVFTTSNTEPIKGRSAYRQQFGRALESEKRDVDILVRDIQDMGEVKVVYQTAQVIQAGVVINFKQSQVWNLSSDGWRLNHLHTALLGNPVPRNPEVDKAGRISVLNEKIASMAAVLGVAQ